jgi:dipeptidyl aminopeptidase/acylaminoacyl peptidase
MRRMPASRRHLEDLQMNAPERAASRIPMRDFFRNEQETKHRVSPDGAYISYLAPYQSRLNVFVKRLDGGAATRVTSETARGISGYFWKGDRILYVRDCGGDENFHLVSVDLSGQDLKDLTPGDKVQAQIIDTLFEDDSHIIVAHNRRDPEVFDVFRTNVITGEEILIAQNPGNITEWKTDHDGRLRVAVTTDGVNRTLLYREREADEFRAVLTTGFKETLVLQLFDFDNRRLYVSSNRGRDTTAIVIFNPVTACEEEVLFEHPDADVSSMTYSRKRKVLTAITYDTWKTQYRFLDGQTEEMFDSLRSKLPGYEIALKSHDRNEDKFIVVAHSDKVPGKTYLLDRTARTLEFICDQAPWIPESELAEMRAVQYTSRDGLTIHGYLTLPRGLAAKSLPVVINPHGGPWYRDTWVYNPEVQFLANRGYAVFPMNFRGSTGYGRTFWQASFKQWGKAMQDDITDGVQWLIDQGIADPERIAIYGGSYGGYATLAGVSFTPKLYAAAIDYCGVSNLFTFINTIPPYWKPYLEMLYEMIGHPEQDKALLEATSPALHAARIQTPLLIAQGANDPRVKKAESDQIVEALRKRGVEVEYLVKDNEGHGFENEENRFDFYSALEQFLARYLGV